MDKSENKNRKFEKKNISNQFESLKEFHTFRLDPFPIAYMLLAGGGGLDSLQSYHVYMAALKKQHTNTTECPRKSCVRSDIPKYKNKYMDVGPSSFQIQIHIE